MIDVGVFVCGLTICSDECTNIIGNILPILYNGAHGGASTRLLTVGVV